MTSSFKFSNVADLGYIRKIDRIKDSEKKLNKRKMTLEGLQKLRNDLVSESISDTEHKIKEYEEFEKKLNNWAKSNYLKIQDRRVKRAEKESMMSKQRLEHIRDRRNRYSFSMREKFDYPQRLKDINKDLISELYEIYNNIDRDIKKDSKDDIKNTIDEINCIKKNNSLFRIFITLKIFEEKDLINNINCKINKILMLSHKSELATFTPEYCGKSRSYFPCSK